MKKSIDDVSAKIFSGSRVFVRVDFNVPFSEDGEISDDSRMQASLPTISKLRQAGARIILASHLGRPKGQANQKYSLRRIAEHLGSLIQDKVRFAENCVGEKTREIVASLKAGEVCLLENLRFHPGEEANDEVFAKDLASLADVYVNDAFGAAHRAHASTEGITKFVKVALAGKLLYSEVKMLSMVLDNPKRPVATIIGGAKVSSKMGVLDNLVDKVDVVIVGGAMAFTFIKAQGGKVGKSLVEDQFIDYCKQVLAKAEEKNVKFILPLDVLASDDMNPQCEVITCPADQIPPEKMGLDVGPTTRELIANELKKCKTILWNGPLGVFEIEKFSGGTFRLIDSLVDLTSKGIFTIAGGGDSVSALSMYRVDKDKLTHVSTGGGASLEFIEGRILPGVACLNAAEDEALVN